MIFLLVSLYKSTDGVSNSETYKKFTKKSFSVYFLFPLVADASSIYY